VAAKRRKGDKKRTEGGKCTRGVTEENWMAGDADASGSKPLRSHRADR